MKSFFLLLCLIPLVHLRAQLEIELVEAQIEEEMVEVANPDAVDHSQPVEKGLESDLLYFLNGDRISGELLEVNAEEGLRWKHPDASTDVVFGLGNLKGVEFKQQMEGAQDIFSLPRIELTNGDHYRGRIRSMDGDKLIIETPLGGTLTIRSDMVQAIRPEVVSSTVYTGPNSLEEWEQNNNGNSGWEFKNNAVYSDNHNQIMGMDLEDPPEMLSFEFTMEWKGNVNMQVGFWGREPTQVNQNCYTLSIQNGYLRCYRNYNKIGRNDLGNAQVRDEMGDGVLDVKLLLNREKKEVMVLFDGKLIARWTDTFDGKIQGDAILFGSMGNSPAKISRIKIREWDGKFDIDAPSKPEDLDELVTTNGDIFVGALQKIEEDLLHFKNDFAVFKVPVDRIAEVTMASATRSIPRLQKGDVKIFFENKERITLELSKVDETRFSGFSEATGDVVLFKKYFNEMKLNPYDERHNKDEDAW